MGQRAKLAGAVLLVLAAGAIGLRSMFRAESGELAFYYDLSEARLYEARAGQVPPTRGVGGEEGDGVLAVVYVCGGRGRAAERRIAYLLTYTPELATLKAQADTASKGQGEYPSQLDDRAWLNANTLVRGADGGQWHAISSEQGQALLAVLTMRCDDGSYPTICDPSD